MEPRTAIVLQARLASQRLPGKALAMVGTRTVLEECLRRLLEARVAPVVLATTENAEDAVLVEVASRVGVECLRGSATDVLGRFVACADAYQLHYVIRATADNPGVDIDAPGRVLAALQQRRVDYVFEEGLPYGAAVEGVTGDALRRAALIATDAGDREHVTTFVRRRADLFRQACLPAPAALARPDVRLTVDTADDVRSIRALYRMAGEDLPAVIDLIEAWDAMARRSVA